MNKGKCEEKIRQTKDLFKALGLPVKLYSNRTNRSVWTFLSLAGLKPEDDWSSAKPGYLTTKNISVFIRDFYGKSYAENTRESIRKDTLHPFEELRIVSRNADDLGRATHDRNNNYSLCPHIIEILHGYPNNAWKAKAEKYKKTLPELKEDYEKLLDKHRIKIKLPSGKQVKLSPGLHNQLHADVIDKFCRNFLTEDFSVLYLGDSASSRNEGGRLMIHEEERLSELNIDIIQEEKYPDLIIYDQFSKKLYLIEVVSSSGCMSESRLKDIKNGLNRYSGSCVYLSVFPDKKTFKKFSGDIAWGTQVWLAEEINNLITYQ